MNDDDTSAADGSSDPTVAVADRWRLPAQGMVQRWLPGRRWRAFAAAVEERHLATFARSSVKRRDQGQGLAAGSQEVPVRLAAGDPTLIGGARGAAESGWRPADAFARRDPRDGQIGRLGTEGDRPAPGVARPPAVAARSAADEQGDAAAGGGIDARWSAGALHGLARTLDPYVQGWLSRLLDLRIPAVRIHTGQAADATARRFHADAVSLGPDIMFRAGRFAPDSASGLGLLGHELTHVAQARSDRPVAPLDRTALGREEAVAIENEKRVLQRATGKPGMTANLAAIPRPTPFRAPTHAPAPRTASVDRAVAPSADGDAVSSAPELSAQQLGALKEVIYRDLMDRIRTEFERGA
jgi:hypothetical protein